MYPKEVLTKTKRGKVEVRVLVNKGEFIRYEYIDPETGERTQNKTKLILKTREGTEEYFLIPMKDGRILMLPTESKGKRKIWDSKKNKPIEF